MMGVEMAAEAREVVEMAVAATVGVAREAVALEVVKAAAVKVVGGLAAGWAE